MVSPDYDYTDICGKGELMCDKYLSDHMHGYTDKICNISVSNVTYRGWEGVVIDTISRNNKILGKFTSHQLIHVKITMNKVQDPVGYVEDILSNCVSQICYVDFARGRKIKIIPEHIRKSKF